MQVLLIDDHPLFRHAIILLLSDLDERLHFTQADTCEQALALLHEKPANLILLGLKMQDIQGRSALLQIRAVYPDIPLAVLPERVDPLTIRQAIDAGASVVPKSFSTEAMVPALKLILAGGVYVPPAVREMVIDSQYIPSNAPQNTSPLSAQWSDVFVKLLQGKSNKTIAREMGIARSAVNAHLSALFKVLSARNRPEDE